jgi:5-formyltetrahydrofolate cyclo-ligase
MEKTLVRQRLKEKRSHLSREEILSLSTSLQQRFIASPLYAAATTIAAYCSFKAEVDTSLLVRRAIADGKRVAMPKVGKAHTPMDFIFIKGDACLSEGAYDIKEPHFDEGRLVHKSDIDIFIVPAVAYDLVGRRIGMGKGYYDRALAGIKRERLVGFVYDFQILEEVPCEAHDIRVGTLVTEKRIVKCF